MKVGFLTASLLLSLPAGAAPVMLGPNTIADLVEKVSPAVVNLDTVAKSRNPLSELDPFFHRFFSSELPRLPRFFEQHGVGSGFLISADGLIITNHHVVRDAGSIKVTLTDGRQFEGKVIGRDPLSDIALLKIQAERLTTVKFADPRAIRVGEWVVAIGSPLGLKTSVTAGIISALNRDVQAKGGVSFIQTDAPINPGNSGGPLLNLEGDVVGMNTMVASNAQGIGFSIPVATIQEVVASLRTAGKIERPWLGVTFAYPAFEGVLIREVLRRGPAEKAGLLGGDRVLEADDRKMQDAGDLIRYIASRKVGAFLRLLISREGHKIVVSVPLEAMPEEALPEE